MRLADGRSLRLVGIDTPELARDGRPAEPLAFRARDRLRDLVRMAGMRLDLVYDLERRDRYGRTLAHAYLPDGRSVSALLLGEGLATMLVVPPNVRSWSCYRDIERAARVAGTGLWALPRYRVREAGQLDDGYRGFARLRGRVAALQRHRKGLRIVLESGFVAWIPLEDMIYFGSLQTLAGRRVELRGRVRPFRDELQIRLRHPAGLSVLEDGERPVSGEDPPLR